MMPTSIARWVREGTDAPVICPPEIETDEELARRNAERLAAAKAKLGQRYLLHPSNHVRREAESRSRVVILTSVAARSPLEERAA
ncbi:MAG: hypothetical protein ACREBN_05920 [Burkholderiaceae bacterium]